MQSTRPRVQGRAAACRPPSHITQTAVETGAGSWQRSGTALQRARLRRCSRRRSSLFERWPPMPCDRRADRRAADTLRSRPGSFAGCRRCRPRTAHSMRRYFRWLRPCARSPHRSRSGCCVRSCCRRAQWPRDCPPATRPATGPDPACSSVRARLAMGSRGQSASALLPASWPAAGRQRCRHRRRAGRDTAWCRHGSALRV